MADLLSGAPGGSRLRFGVAVSTMALLLGGIDSAWDGAANPVFARNNR